ncbi:AMP-binding protein [Blastococcus sp. TML/M2B]|uniref:AMP-binding protein n=1 Tax=unclassified Blastococcus TaxID=2619396 RepID=UPI0019091D88|nr:MULTISPECIES: AMP-binding protein [unclassified Blastococcus]MBN1092883.1 AMP-binding protein [Blastococcus sp. TML/M2B]MBN1097008.1 AMP-binding protein [Blastococcus sp. TML/C7B]
MTESAQPVDGVEDLPEPVPIGVQIGVLAERYGDAPAVACEGTTRSWIELDRRTNRLARALLARGVVLGDLVTIGLPNSVEFVEACVAAWKIGAVPQPVSAALPPLELQGVVELANPPLVVARGDIPLDRPIADVDELIAGSDDDSPLPPAIAPAYKAPTSGGSTGRPKLIVSGQTGVVDPLGGGAVWRHRPGGTLLMPGPLYHNGPFTSAMGGLLGGSTLVLMPRFDAEAVLRLVEQHRATWLYLVPAMMSRIWRLPEDVRGRYDLSSLETVWHLAAPCPPWLKEAWIDWVGGEVLMELYAGTEAQAGTVISGTEWLAHRGSVGKTLYGEITILGPDGEQLPAGTVGEVFMRRGEGQPPSYRYIGAEARTRGDWESLGDVGWMDEDGYLYLADRRTDMVLVGGSNVYPAEVEAALDEHPQVASSAVIGLPDDDLGQVVHAIVQPAPGVDAVDLDDLRRYLADRLVRYKQPRTFEFVSEPLRDDAGKIRRSQLLADRVAAQQ